MTKGDTFKIVVNDAEFQIKKLTQTVGTPILKMTKIITFHKTLNQGSCYTNFVQHKAFIYKENKIFRERLAAMYFTV